MITGIDSHTGIQMRQRPTACCMAKEQRWLLLVVVGMMDRYGMLNVIVNDL